jgi:hypothetical protein
MGGRASPVRGPSKRGGRRPEIGLRLRSLTLVLISALVAAGAGSVGVPTASRAGGNASPSGAPRATAYRLTAASGSVGPSRPAPSAQSVSVGTVPPAADEVPGLRTRTSDTYLVDGEYEALVYSGSVNYQDSRGSWQPIDETLVPSTAAGYSWQNRANRYTLLLPSTLSGSPIAFRSPSGTISLQLAGARGTASVSGDSTTYASALPGINLTLKAEQDAVKESLVLTGASSATSLVYSLGLSSGLRASATAAGGVAITDSTGTRLLFSFDPPTMSDAAGAQAPASAAILRLGTTASGTTVTLALDKSWLQSSARQWPVTVDPSINYDSDQDCQIQNGTKADTNLCGSGQY